MDSRISKILLIISLVMVCISCGTEREFFIKKSEIEDGYSYVSDVTVTKRGFYFLWFIPFRSSSEEAAREVLIDETLEEFPQSAGLYQYQLLEKTSVSFLDWVPETRITGKIVKKTSEAKE